MSKPIWLSFLSALFLLSTGCQAMKNSGSEVSVKSSSATAEPSISSSYPNSQSVEEKDYQFNRAIDALLTESVGDYRTLIPVCPAESYQGSNVERDNYGITATAIYCFSSTDGESLSKAYKASLNRRGFSFSASSSENTTQGAYRRVSPNQILFVLFDPFALSEGSGLRIVAYLYQDKRTSFPEQEIKNFIGSDIPAAEADYYTAERQTSYGIDRLYIACYRPKEGILDSYSALLKQNGYTVTDNYGTRYADKGNIGLTYLYRTQEESVERGFEGDRDVFLIAVYDISSTTSGNEKERK